MFVWLHLWFFWGGFLLVFWQFTNIQQHAIWGHVRWFIFYRLIICKTVKYIDQSDINFQHVLPINISIFDSSSVIGQIKCDPIINVVKCLCIANKISNRHIFLSRLWDIHAPFKLQNETQCAFNELGPYIYTMY
jgi:hypothetical protein